MTTRRALTPFRGLATALLLLGLSNTQCSCDPETVTGLAVTAVADPKLDQGQVRIDFSLARQASVKITVEQGPTLVAVVWDGVLEGGARNYTWNGKDAGGNPVPPGGYSVKVSAAETEAVAPLHIVRLGITSIAVTSMVDGGEHQLVYAQTRDTADPFVVTDENEYVNRGTVAELDDPSGQPLAPVAYTDNPKEPVTNPDQHNQPLCFTILSRPRFDVVFGQTAVKVGAGSVDCGVPLAGYDILCQAQGTIDGVATDWTSDVGSLVLRPWMDGSTMRLRASFTGPPLPLECGKWELAVNWTFKAKKQGGSDWFPIPGSLVTQHLLYTVLGRPNLPAALSGERYSGPWIRLLDTFEQLRVFKERPRAKNEADVVALVVEATLDRWGPGIWAGSGFRYGSHQDSKFLYATDEPDALAFDPNAFTLPTPLTTSTLGLTELFAVEDWSKKHCDPPGPACTGFNGVQCSDVNSTAAWSVAMLGVRDAAMARLNTCTPKPDGFVRLIGGSEHPVGGFQYHHVFVRNNGTLLFSDACLGLVAAPSFMTDKLYDQYVAAVLAVAPDPFSSDSASGPFIIDPLPSLY